MASVVVHNVRFAGVAACVPADVSENSSYTHLSEDERRRVIQTTGIERFRRAPADVCTSDLCCRAAATLLDALEWSRHEVEVLVFVTQTPDYPIPATAPIIQDRLGLPQSCIAFDVNLGCSGYTYGLQIVASLLAAGGLRRGLLLVGDTPSKFTSRLDRSTAPLFGDAGAATALETSEGSRMCFDSGTDGSGFDAIIVSDGGYRNVTVPESLEVVDVEDGIARSRCQLRLAGIEVFNFSVREVPKTVRNVLQLAGRDIADVDACVFHQANKFMNQVIRKKLKFDSAQVPYSLRDFGNTISASIPVTLVTELRERLSTGDVSLVLCGFGSGLSWSTAYLEARDVVCPPLVEV